MTSTSRAITLDKDGNGVPDDDPRWVIGPHFKYLRSQTALLKPLTRQELNVLIPDKQLRGHQRTIDNTKYNYECEKHEDRLLNFREEQSMKTYRPTPPTYTEPENDFDNLDYMTNPRNMNLHEVRGMINLFNQHLRDPSTQPYEIREMQDRLDELHDRENELRQEARNRSPRVHDRRRHDSGAKASTVPLGASSGKTVTLRKRRKRSVSNRTSTIGRSSENRSRTEITSTGQPMTRTRITTTILRTSKTLTVSTNPD